MAADKELAAALIQSRTRRMYYALALKGGTDGALLVSKTKIPKEDVDGLKKTVDTKVAVKGFCSYDAEKKQYVFETPKAPGPTWSATTKKIVRQQAGLTIEATFVLGEDPDEEHTEPTDSAATSEQYEAAKRDLKTLIEQLQLLASGEQASVVKNISLVWGQAKQFAQEGKYDQAMACLAEVERQGRALASPGEEKPELSPDEKRWRDELAKHRGVLEEAIKKGDEAGQAVRLTLSEANAAASATASPRDYAAAHRLLALALDTVAHGIPQNDEAHYRRERAGLEAAYTTMRQWSRSSSTPESKPASMAVSAMGKAEESAKQGNYVDARSALKEFVSQARRAQLAQAKMESKEIAISELAARELNQRGERLKAALRAGDDYAATTRFLVNDLNARVTEKDFVKFKAALEALDKHLGKGLPERGSSSETPSPGVKEVAKNLEELSKQRARHLELRGQRDALTDRAIESEIVELAKLLERAAELDDEQDAKGLALQLATVSEKLGEVTFAIAERDRIDREERRQLLAEELSKLVDDVKLAYESAPTYLQDDDVLDNARKAALVAVTETGDDAAEKILEAQDGLQKAYTNWQENVVSQRRVYELVGQLDSYIEKLEEAAEKARSSDDEVEKLIEDARNERESAGIPEDVDDDAWYNVDVSKYRSAVFRALGKSKTLLGPLFLKQAKQDFTTWKGTYAPFEAMEPPTKKPTLQTDTQLQIGVIELLFKQKTALAFEEFKQFEDWMKELVAAVEELKKKWNDDRDEIAFLDSKDGGHSVKRHGPNIPPEKLKGRLTDGIAPDGVLSPTKYSSAFLTYDLMLWTRKAAIAQIQSDEKVDFGSTMTETPKGSRTVFSVSMDHGKTVGKGWKGKGKQKKKVRGQLVDVYTSCEEVPSLTKTSTTIQWDGKRWCVKQHFPTS